MRSRTSIPAVTVLLLALGFTVAGYLLHRTFLLLEGRPGGAIDICSAIFGSGCDATLSGSGSWILGIPLAGWALVYYTALSVLLWVAWGGGRILLPPALVVARLLSLAATLGSLVLLGLLLGGAVSLCPLCLVANTLNLALAGAVWRLGGPGQEKRTLTLLEGKRVLLGGSPDPARNVMGLLLPLLAALLVYQWTFLQVELRRRGTRFNPGMVVAGFARQPREAVPTGPEDPRRGPEDALVTLVVFSDFQCPGCHSLSRILEPMVDHFAPDVALVFKHFPLNRTCNPSYPRDRHPEACAAAWAAEAARRQGKFWAFHDALFDGGLSQGEEDLLRAARAADLDLDRFQADREDPAVREKVAADIELGQELGLPGTPTVYLNGKQVSLLSRETLLTLVAFERETERAVRNTAAGS